MEEQLRQSFDILCPSSGAQQAAAADALQRPLRSRFQARLSASVRRLASFEVSSRPCDTDWGSTRWS